MVNKHPIFSEFFKKEETLYRVLSENVLSSPRRNYRAKRNALDCNFNLEIYT